MSLLEFPDLPESHMNPRAFDGRNDCSDLPNLSVGSVMHNLRLRYQAKVSLNERMIVFSSVTSTVFLLLVLE